MNPIWAVRAARVGRLALFLSGLLALVCFLMSLHLTLNVTPSMPLGWYRLHTIDRPLARGDIVQLCAPPSVAKIAFERGLLPPGPCSSHTAPILKFVAAIGGDVVDVRDEVIVINGMPLWGSARLRVDRVGRSVPRISSGRYTLRPGKIWLWSPYVRSWDSRYFGPLAAADVRGLARIVWVRGPGDEFTRGLRNLLSIPQARAANPF